jgi:hypothetical protein
VELYEVVGVVGTDVTIAWDVGLEEIVVFEVDVELIAVVDLELLCPILTQYAESIQKLSRQSDETAGFHLRNCSKDMP